jgi:hypothetical protein
MAEHQLERPCAAQLIGKGGAVGRTGIAGLRGVGHRPTVWPNIGAAVLYVQFPLVETPDPDSIIASHS